MIKYDIHNHTHLSSCAQRDAFLADYIKKAKEIGLKLIGIADHCWETSIPGASDWYSDQGYERLVSRREELKNIDTEGVKVLLGAEGEYACELLAVNDNSLKYVDYLIIPHSHTHMRGFVLPKECIGDHEKHAEYLVRSFISLCKHEMSKHIFGIAHPMYPIGDKTEYVEKLYTFLTDEALEECARTAKEANIAIEANLSVLSQIPQNSCYKRFFDACKKAGCEFFLGSDSHAIGSLDIHNRQAELISIIGLTEDDFKAAERRILNA